MRRSSVTKIGAVLGTAALLAQPAKAEPILFGFAAIACDVDDPHDTGNRTDYIDEVAGWTSANQVCITADRDTLIDRLRRSAAAFSPVFLIEPVFFERRGSSLYPNPNAAELWLFTQDAIAASGIDPAKLIFYVADEPLHFGLSRTDVEQAVAVIDAAYPSAQTLVIEARPAVRADAVPRNVDFWGFNAYAIADPATDAGYQRNWQTSLDALGPNQRLAVIIDAVHTPFHVGLGLTPQDMGAVALAYEALIEDTPQVGLALGYTWPGGIDGAWETGLRTMPRDVIETYRQVGARLMTR